MSSYDDPVVEMAIKICQYDQVYQILLTNLHFLERK